MSPRQKTSQAIILSARINPRTSDKDRMALEIIRDLEEKGYKRKQIIVDAILARGGATPEMFDQETFAQQIMSHLETVLADFSVDLLRNIKSRDDIDIDESDDGEVSRFTTNFAKGFIERQQQVLGDDEK